MTHAEMTMERPLSKTDENGDWILTKAVLKAALLLEISDKIMAEILGLRSITSLQSGANALQPKSQEFKEAVMFVRLFTSLHDIVGGDQKVAISWLRNHNFALNGLPIDIIKTPTGLRDVIAYLDSRRAPC